MTSGIGVVMMDKWTPEETLKLIDQHRITHSFFVPTMFMRMLQLPEDIRKQYDMSSLKFIIHGAAPCSIDTKQQMLDWFGPVIWEMFASTEGPGTIISPQEWLQKPGTVGKPGPGQIKIVGEGGEEVAPVLKDRFGLLTPRTVNLSTTKLLRKRRVRSKADISRRVISDISTTTAICLLPAAVQRRLFLAV